jgi:hypothetical protein
MTIAANYPTVAPSLDLDFANSQQLDPRISFTRAATATYYDENTSALAEQNLALQSQTFDNASWIKQSVTVVADNTTAPDGTTTADLMYPTTTGAFRSLYQAFSAGNIVSVYGKASGISYLWFINNTGGAIAAWFDLSTGVTGTVVAGYTSSIESVGNGWYRCILRVNTGVFAGPQIGLSDADNSNTATTSGTNGIFIWGTQVEQRSAVTAYNLTTTARITNYIPQLLTAPLNTPRFDFNPTTRVSLGLLIEQQSTNLLFQSEDFLTTWTTTRATVSTNINIAPSSALTADGLIASTDNDTHFVSQTFTGTAVSHTFTVYAKAFGLNFIALRLFNGATQVGLAYYNLSTGATGTVTAGTASIQSVGNNWYRCALTATLAASASCTADIQLANADNTNSFAGNAFSGVTIWGAQVEETAFPTSYIPTGVSSVIRSADSASITGTNFSSWFNNQQGSVYCSFDSASIGAPAMSYWAIDNNSNAGYYANRATGSATLTVFQGSASASAGTITANTTQQNAYSYNNTSGSLAASGLLNGGSIGTITPVQLTFLPTQLSLGKHISNTSPMTGHIRKFAYYPIATTTAQMQALTGS